MPFEYNWKLVYADCSILEIEAFLDAQKTYGTPTSQRTLCTVCEIRVDSHKMHYAIYACQSATCTSAGDRCEWHAMSKLCESAGRGSLHQHAHHLSSIRSPPRPELNLAQKRFVREQTANRLKPSRILNKMIDRYKLDNAYPLLRPVQRCSVYYRTTVTQDNNDVDDLETVVASKPYHSGLDELTTFAFGYPTTPSGSPAFMIGSDALPFVVGFSTKRLMKNLIHAATHILHVDATFKLNTSSFPVVIFGVSDSWRQFHPVALFITTDLKEAQIAKAVRATLRQFQSVTGTLAVVNYIMGDADVAQRNALEAVIQQELNVACLPTYLMCFFHVMANVKKYIGSLNSVARALVFRHVYRIQYSRSTKDLQQRIAEAQRAWQQRQDCLAFGRRFTKQWLCGRSTAWHCLASPPGHAKTNNPVEQFNKQVKLDYTLCGLVTVNTLAQDLIDLAHHQSSRGKSFEIMSRPSEDLVRRYKQLIKEGRLVVTPAYRSSVSFMLDGVERRQYRVMQTGNDPVKLKKKLVDTLREEEQASDRDIEVFQQPSTGWRVDVDEASCQCRHSFKYGTCAHIIAAQVVAGMYVEGVTKKRKFVTKRVNKRGRRAAVGAALSLD